MAWDFCFFKSTALVQSTEPQSAVLKAGALYLPEADFALMLNKDNAPIEGEAATISWKVPHVHTGLPQHYSGERPRAAKRTFW